MKKTIYILALLVLTSCSNKKEQKKNTTEINSEIKNIESTISKLDTARIGNYTTELKDWLNYYKRYSLNTENFNFVQQDNLPEVAGTINRSFDISNDIYKPFYKYSADSSKVLDLVSYNLLLKKNKKNEIVSYDVDIDNEVSLYDLKNKLWKRLLFVGSPYTIEDGFWVNNNQLLIVGELHEADEDKFKPSLWFVDLKANIIQTFEYKSFISNMNCNYLEKVKYKNLQKDE